MDYKAFKHNPIIVRGMPNGVTYDLSETNQTTITLPPQSTWSSELHWHEQHTEYLRVVKGSVRVRLGLRTFTVSAPKAGQPDAVVTVDTYVRHEWSRADRECPSSEKDEEDVVVIESTGPIDSEKHLFFWNINGTILEAQHTAREDRRESTLPFSGTLADLNITLRLFIIFAVLDNYPALMDVEGWAGSGVLNRAGHAFQWLLAHIVLKFAVLIGYLLRINAVEERFTPDKLMRKWRERSSAIDGKTV